LALGCSGDSESPAAGPSPSATPLRTQVELRPVELANKGGCPAGLTAPEGGALLAFGGECLALRPPELVLTQAVSVTAGVDRGPVSSGEHVVTVIGDPEGVRALTETYVGKRLAIVIAGEVYGAPVIESPITDGGVVVYAGSEARANDLKRLLTG
jgi:hypothetical protein